MEKVYIMQEKMGNKSRERETKKNIKGSLEIKNSTTKMKNTFNLDQLKMSSRNSMETTQYVLK